MFTLVPLTISFDYDDAEYRVDVKYVPESGEITIKNIYVDDKRIQSPDTFSTDENFEAFVGFEERVENAYIAMMEEDLALEDLQFNDSVDDELNWDETESEEYSTDDID